MSLSTEVQPGNLAHFLKSQNEALIGDLKAGKGAGWVIATGNEAGDLDSLASAIGYAYLSSALEGNRTAALFLTPKKLMNLRPENLLALQRANIPLDAILHPEDLPSGTEKLADTGVRFALVDHNHLLPAFGNHPDAVSAVLDHHEDEGEYPKASPRTIVTPLGSTASLVTAHFMQAWKASVSGPAGPAGSPVPPELATLLLSAILIDTQGLKKGGKAMDTDYKAAAFLYPLSTLVNGSVTALTAADSPERVPALQAFSSLLATTKFDVSGMSTIDLLQRDYKQYAWPTTAGELSVGLSTVPMSLKNQLTADGGWQKYMDTLDAFMAERAIDVEGVLTTYKSEDKSKGRRELLLAVRSGQGTGVADLAAARRILAALGAGLEADSETFALTSWGKGAGKASAKAELAAESGAWLETGTRAASVWQQGNHHSTRKQVAPALMELVAKL